MVVFGFRYLLWKSGKCVQDRRCCISPADAEDIGIVSGREGCGGWENVELDHIDGGV